LTNKFGDEAKEGKEKAKDKGKEKANKKQTMVDGAAGEFDFMSLKTFQSRFVKIKFL
jgi:hypothetical protein